MNFSVLAYIAKRMTEIGVPYAFGRWEGPKASESTCYFVGEYNEIETMDRRESGRQETKMILRGYTRGPWYLLEQHKAAIEKLLPGITILEDGTGLAMDYDYGMIVPTGDADLKSMKINLTIQEWRVDQ